MSSGLVSRRRTDLIRLRISTDEARGAEPMTPSLAEYSAKVVAPLESEAQAQSTVQRAFA